MTMVANWVGRAGPRLPTPTNAPRSEAGRRVRGGWRDTRPVHPPGSVAVRAPFTVGAENQRSHGRGDPRVPRALLLENVDPVATDLLGAAGYEVESLRGALDEIDLIAALEGVD